MPDFPSCRATVDCESPCEIGIAISVSVFSAVGDKEVQSRRSRISVVRSADEAVEGVGALLPVSPVHPSPEVDDPEAQSVVEERPELTSWGVNVAVDLDDDLAQQEAERLVVVRRLGAGIAGEELERRQLFVDDAAAETLDVEDQDVPDRHRLEVGNVAVVQVPDRRQHARVGDPVQGGAAAPAVAELHRSPGVAGSSTQPASSSPR